MCELCKLPVAQLVYKPLTSQEPRGPCGTGPSPTWASTLFKVNLNVVPSVTRSLKCLFPSCRLSDENYSVGSFLCSVRAPCLAHDIVFDLVIVIISSEAYHQAGRDNCVGGGGVVGTGVLGKTLTGLPKV